MAKRQSEDDGEASSSKVPKIMEDDDLSDHEIEVDHMPMLIIP